MVLLIEPRKISLSIRKRDSVTLQTQILNVFSRRIASSHNQYVFVLDRVRSHVEEQSLFERRRQSIFLRFIRPAKYPDGAREGPCFRKHPVMIRLGNARLLLLQVPASRKPRR